MQPKIIVSKNREARAKEIWDLLEKLDIKPNNPDLFLLEDEKIGISQVKQLIKHLSTKSFGKTPKSAVILEGSTISPDAQNALLKILEEPPGNSIILIGTDSETRLLTTVLSRCLIVNLDYDPRNNDSDFSIDHILNASVEERFDLIEKTTDKEQLLNNLVSSYRKRLIEGTVSGKFLEDLLQAQIWKESNVNIRTILEYLMLKLEK